MGFKSCPTWQLPKSFTIVKKIVNGGRGKRGLCHR